MFFKMLQVGFRPNDLTLVSALSACAKIGALEAGVHIHDYVLEHGFRLNKTIGTALVDMYAKCGNIPSASKVFDETKEDILTWSVMIWGWGNPWILWASHPMLQKDDVFRCGFVVFIELNILYSNVSE
ncbi:hypothetical protein REPUB_Repub20aG0058400 [Reevesia pubescens]